MRALKNYVWDKKYNERIKYTKNLINWLKSSSTLKEIQK